MDKLNPADRFRYAWSFLEAARANPAFAGQARRAGKTLERVRSELRRDLDRHGEDLRATLERQRQLSDWLISGRVDPAKANALNREYTATSDELRGRITELNGVLAAQGSEDLGGFIDAAPAGYARALRAPSAKIDLMPTPIGFAVWLVVFTCSILGSLSYLGMLHLGTPIGLRAEFKPGLGGLDVACKNGTNAPIVVRVPWSDDDLLDKTAQQGAAVYGLAVRVKEKGKDFREVAVPPECWTYLGVPLLESAPVRIEPGTSVNLKFALKKLAGIEPNPEAVQLILRRTDGATVTQCETPLSKKKP